MKEPRPVWGGRPRPPKQKSPPHCPKTSSQIYSTFRVSGPVPPALLQAFADAADYMQPATAAKCAAAKVQCHSARARRQSAPSSAAPSPRPCSRQTPPAAARPTCSPTLVPCCHCSQPRSPTNIKDASAYPDPEKTCPRDNLRPGWGQP